MNNLKTRVLTGIGYFREIQPSRFNAAHFTHLKVFLDLVEDLVLNRPAQDDELTKTAEQIFGSKTE